MTEVINDVIINYQSKNLDQTVGGIKQTSVALDGLVVASTSTERATTSLENKFASLERRFGTTAAQTAQYEKIQKDVNLAVANNPALQDRANEVLKAAEARYLGAGTAVKALAEAHKGLDAQGQAAFHSIRSVVEQLALGIPPTQALTGQLNHLSFAASGEGGLAGAFGQVGGLVKNLITPMTIAIGTTAALAAGVAALALSYDKVQVSSQRALIGAGARTGTTVGDLNNFTSQNSGISGTGLSNKEARSLAEDFTKSGEIVISQLHGMSDAVVGFANQTGKSITEASKDFVQFGEDPKKGIEALTAAFGPLDRQTRDLVETYTLAGNKTAALNALIDATAEKAKKAADNMGVLDKIWRGITTFAGTEATKPSDPLEAARAKLNTAISSAPDMLNTAEASQNVERLSREFEKLQEAREKAIGQAAADNLNKLDTEAERAREQVAAIAKSWGDVGVATALALNALQQQVAIAGAVTGQQQMAAQYAADFANWVLQGRTELEAEALASEKLAVSQAAATAAVEKQVQALKDQNAMIKAHANGTEATTAASIAYRNAIESGADQTAAAALKAQTLKNYMLQASAAASSFASNVGMASTTLDSLGRPVRWETIPGDYNSGNAWTSSFDVQAGPRLGNALTPEGEAMRDTILMNQALASRLAGGGKAIIDKAFGAGGIDAAIAAAMKIPTKQSKSLDYMGQDLSAPSADFGSVFSNIDALYQLKNALTTDKGQQVSNLQQEMAWLQSQPQTLAQMQAIVNLQKSIDQLKNSTDDLNSTNRDLLSPFYSQDPRTSHIGFRSQGMASGGYVDVPGMPSANDNMIATIPVASGERIYVDPMPSVRGGAGGQTINVSISAPVTINGNANKDEVGRTLYQNNQNLANQIVASLRR